MQLIEFLLITAGTVLLVLWAWVVKRQKAPSEHHVPRQIVSGLSAESAAKLQKSLTELLHELHTLSRDVTVDLEQKLSELKELLQLADKKLEELSLADAKEEYIRKWKTESRAEQQIPTPSSEPELEIIVEDDDTPLPPSNRYQEIYRMADEGLAIDDIARRMQMGKGEIQLILSLRKRD